ncbi:hypothetical protein F5984_20530 [Rudanella paleaurantiibacter]|uniref:Uncharacterized protein n=1 Tax=Rudanella paleaurantiibacter TaxID=2614655 RepID=A0A7J5TVL5_9BACT|nr:hypothetical protein F5984_20530 [Rudanella paleaurantiibacter]
MAILEDTDAKGCPRPFSITFCTADQAKGTGGEIIHYKRAVWHVAGGRVKASDRDAARVDDQGPKSKRPNHAANWTRNIRGLDTDQIRKIHIHLILEINGKPVR